MFCANILSAFTYIYFFQINTFSRTILADGIMLIFYTRVLCALNLIALSTIIPNNSRRVTYNLSAGIAWSILSAIRAMYHMPNLYLPAGDSTILVGSHFSRDTHIHTFTRDRRLLFAQSHALDSRPGNFHLDFLPVSRTWRKYRRVWNLSRTEIFPRREDINAPDIYIYAVNGSANVCRAVDYQ